MNDLTHLQPVTICQRMLHGCASNHVAGLADGLPFATVGDTQSMYAWPHRCKVIFLDVAHHPHNHVPASASGANAML